ncbi:Uncharacterized protein OBRU01_19812, partial [Operophtera brumata]
MTRKMPTGRNSNQGPSQLRSLVYNAIRTMIKSP